MGLFDFIKPKKQPSVEQSMYNKNICGYRDLKDSIDYQDALLQQVNEAYARYEQDHDLNAVIAAFEHAFIESDPPCISSQNMMLVDYYIKAGQNNKAWGYLNRLIVTQNAPIDKIRFAQAKLLKKEKKYLDALEMCLIGHFHKYCFTESVFYKDLQVYAKKLNLEQNQLDYLKNIVISSKDESDLIGQYRNTVKEWRLI